MRRKTLTRTRRTRKRLLVTARVALLRSCAFACRSVSRRVYHGPFVFAIVRWAL